MRKTKAIFFDMDGVLVDARDLHYEALNAALAPFGLPISRDAHLTTFDGLSTRQKLVILSETLGLPTGLHDLIHELKQQHTYAKISLHCRPVFRHRYMLSRLRQRGVPAGALLELGEGLGRGHVALHRHRRVFRIHAVERRRRERQAVA